MTTHTLTEDKRMEDLPLASGDTIALNAHVLTCESNFFSLLLKATGSGTICILDGGYANFSNGIDGGVTVEGGTEEAPLPAHGDYDFPGRASAAIEIPQYGDNAPRFSIISHSETNSARQQFSRIASATNTSITFSEDWGIEPGDYIFPDSKDFLQGLPSKVLTYDHQTRTATFAQRATVPQTGHLVLLATAAFVVTSGFNQSEYISCNGNVVGDEVGFYCGGDAFGVLSSQVAAKRLVVVAGGGAYGGGVFSNGAAASCGLVIANCSLLYPATVYPPNQPNTFSVCNCDKAYAQGIYENARASAAPFSSLLVGGGNLSTWGRYDYAGGIIGRVEFVDTTLQQALYATIDPRTELVIRTTSPETCVIHRAGGIATLVKKGGGDAVMAQAPVASAYQLAPTGADAVWHDQAVTVEAGARLTVAWRGHFDADTIGGVQILADSPLFGQFAVPMGTAEVLAEYTESTPSLGVWSPSRLLSWRNTSDQPVRVWVRGWGKVGTVYSSAQVVKGGAL